MIASAEHCVHNMLRSLLLCVSSLQAEGNALHIAHFALLLLLAKLPNLPTERHTHSPACGCLPLPALPSSVTVSAIAFTNAWRGANYYSSTMICLNLLPLRAIHPLPTMPDIFLCCHNKAGETQLQRLDNSDNTSWILPPAVSDSIDLTQVPDAEAYVQIGLTYP